MMQICIASDTRKYAKMHYLRYLRGIDRVKNSQSMQEICKKRENDAHMHHFPFFLCLLIQRGMSFDRKKEVERRKYTSERGRGLKKAD